MSIAMHSEWRRMIAHIGKQLVRQSAGNILLKSPTIHLYPLVKVGWIPFNIST